MTGILDRIRSTASRTKALLRKSPLSWRLLYRGALYLLLFSVAYVFIFPFLYMLVTSIKSPKDLADFTINWIPRAFHKENYILAYNILDYWKYFKNSVILTGFGIIGHLASGSFIGYGFARYRFPGSRLLFAIVILSLIVPLQTIVIPMYILYSRIGFLQSYMPIVVPTLFGFGLRGGLFIFIFRQFFSRLPEELEDAAKIDGCNFLGTWRRIVLPISQPAILVSTILAMVWHWHDFYEPLIFIRDSERLPLTSMLPELFDLLERLEADIELVLAMGEEAALLYNDALAMAATVLAILPILIVFIFVQRYFIRGVERTGLVE